MMALEPATHLSPTHGAQRLGGLRVDPFDDAVHMKGMIAGAPNCACIHPSIHSFIHPSIHPSIEQPPLPFDHPTLTNRTPVPGDLAFGAAAVKGSSTNAAGLIGDIPSPVGDAMPPAKKKKSHNRGSSRRDRHGCCIHRSIE